MKVEFKDGNFQFNAYDVVEVIMREHPDLVEAVACDTRVIDFVTQQIINKWTENGSYGYVGSAQSVQYAGLDKAWRDVAKASGEVAKREITRLEDSLARVDKRYLDLLDETAPFRRTG